MENPHATSLPLLDEVKLQARVGRTSAFGAFCPFSRVLANVPSPNPQRSLSLGGGNRS